MANFTPSNLLAAQANLINKFAAGEMRYRRPAAWIALLDQQAIATPDYKLLRTREDRNLQLNFFLRKQRALGTGRTFNPTGASGDTSTLVPAFATRSDASHISIKQLDNNVRSFQEAFNSNVMNSVINMIEGLNVEAENFIFANRSGVNNAVNAEGDFNTTTDVFEVSEDDISRFLQIIQSTMDINKYSGASIDLYCDTRSFNLFKFAINQGNANSVNLLYQFLDADVKFTHCPSFNAAALALGYGKGFCVAVERGMAVALDWIPKQNREGVSQTQIGGQGEYSNILNPVDGLSYAAFKKWLGGDFQAVNGQTQDVRETLEISIDRAFEYAPLSVATETPLLAFGIVDSLAS
jgi:hypothetical protein